MQGNPSTDAAGGALDLDALLATRLLMPAPVQLGGHTYYVRTDLTASETAECVKLFTGGGKDVDGFAILLGNAEDAVRMDTFLAALPKQLLRPTTTALMRASVVLADYTTSHDDDFELDGQQAAEGESSAS